MTIRTFAAALFRAGRLVFPRPDSPQEPAPIITLLGGCVLLIHTVVVIPIAVLGFACWTAATRLAQVRRERASQPVRRVSCWFSAPP